MDHAPLLPAPPGHRPALPIHHPRRSPVRSGVKLLILPAAATMLLATACSSVPTQPHTMEEIEEAQPGLIPGSLI